MSDRTVYAYVGDDPVSLNDPSGRCPWCAAGLAIGVWSNIASQLAQNGGDWGQLDPWQVALAGLGGALSGGLGTYAAGFGTAASIGLNTIGSGAISAAQQVASNAVSGKCLDADVGSNAVRGGLFGLAGAAIGSAINAGSSWLNSQAFNNLPLADRLFLGSNAVSGWPASPWAIGGTITGNVFSNVISNLNQ